MPQLFTNRRNMSSQSKERLNREDSLLFVIRATNRQLTPRRIAEFHAEIVLRLFSQVEKAVSSNPLVVELAAGYGCRQQRDPCVDAMLVFVTCSNRQDGVARSAPSSAAPCFAAPSLARMKWRGAIGKHHIYSVMELLLQRSERLDSCQLIFPECKYEALKVNP